MAETIRTVDPSESSRLMEIGQVTALAYLAIEPYVRKAVVALGILHAERGQNALAQDLYQRYLQDYPEGPESAGSRFRLVG